MIQLAIVIFLGAAYIAAKTALKVCELVNNARINKKYEVM